jgi:hypothetical protein
MKFNFLVTGLAALVPTVLGFIWYHPKVLGTVWQKVAGVSDDQIKNANMLVIFVVSLILSIMLALQINILTIHQFSLGSIVQAKADSELAKQFVKMGMDNFGTDFRTFKHGMLHGAIAGLFFMLPILATNAMFERKGFKYIAVNAGYWILTLMIMGGIICQFT